MKKTIASIFCVFFSCILYAEEYIVKMVTEQKAGKFYLEPKTITIKSGDTVTWLNVEDDVHNVVADSVPKGAKFFESPYKYKKGEKWSYKFTVPGTYKYHCHPHAALGMSGSVIVDKPSKASELQTKKGHHHGEHMEHNNDDSHMHHNSGHHQDKHGHGHHH